MSLSLNHAYGLQDQICYVQCGYCTTLLLVSVPCSSLWSVVRVKCGHCWSLLSVNMMKASFLPLRLFPNSSLINQHHLHQVKLPGVANPPGILMDADQKELEYRPTISTISSNEEDDFDVPVNFVFNKPPEKRQRAPSAYNCFIKEEIRRLKSINPSMPHKQVFSTAAKNWAHFPQSQHKAKEERSGHGNKI